MSNRIRKLLCSGAIMIFLFQVGIQNSYSSVSEELPLVYLKDYQVWISDILSDPNLETDRQVGGSIELLNLEQTDSSVTHSFTIPSSEHYQFTRLDIETKLQSDSVYYIRQKEEEILFRTKAFEQNVFELLPGDYEISFGNLDDVLSFRMWQVQFPFAGDIGVLDPTYAYDNELLVEYMNSGGVLLAYDNDDFLSSIGVSVSHFDLEPSYDVQALPEGLAQVALLDFSDYRGLYMPINELSSSLSAEDLYLSAYIPFDGGGLIVVSRSVMASSREDLLDYLSGLETIIFSDSSSNVIHINQFNNIFSTAIVLLGVLILWNVFNEHIVKIIKNFNYPNTLESIRNIGKKQNKTVSQRSKLFGSFLTWLGIAFGIILFLGFYLVRRYQLRKLPGSLLNSLDNLNFLLDSLGFDYFFSYILLFILAVEVIATVFIIQRMLKTHKYTGFVKKLSSKLQSYQVLTTKLFFGGKILVIACSVLIFAAQIFRFIGLYPTELHYELRSSDIEGDFELIEGSVIGESVSYTLDPFVNYRSAALSVDAEINSDTEVYLSVTQDKTDEVLLYSPEINDEFTGTYNGIRYYTFDNFDLNSGESLEMSLRNYDSLGIDRMTLHNAYSETPQGDTVRWADLLADKVDLRNEKVVNTEMTTYEFNDLSGQFEFYTIINDGEFEASLIYEVHNLDGNPPGVFAAVLDDNNNVLALESVRTHDVPIGNSLIGSLNISLEEVSSGVIRIVVGYDPKRVLLNKDIGDLDKKIIFKALELNSNKLVFRPISERWAMFSPQMVYIKRNENHIKMNKALSSGFNEFSEEVTDISEIPEFMIGMIPLSSSTGNLLSSHYSLYTTDRDSYFNPFYIAVTEIDRGNEVILSRGLPVLEGINIASPLKLTFFTLDGQRFILGQPIIVDLLKINL